MFHFIFVFISLIKIIQINVELKSTSKNMGYFEAAGLNGKIVSGFTEVMMASTKRTKTFHVNEIFSKGRNVQVMAYVHQITTYLKFLSLFFCLRRYVSSSWHQFLMAKRPCHSIEIVAMILMRNGTGQQIQQIFFFCSNTSNRFITKSNSKKKCPVNQTMERVPIVFKSNVGHVQYTILYHVSLSR